MAKRKKGPPPSKADRVGEDRLNVKQRLFVEAIVGPAAGIAYRAAKMAGYTGTHDSIVVQSARLLNNPIVQECISRALARKCATPEWAKERLIDVARSNMGNYISIDENGKPVIDLKKAQEAAALGQIKEFSADVIPGKDGAADEVVRFKIKIHDPVPAVALLLKLHRLLDGEGSDDDRVIRARRVDRFLGKAKGEEVTSEDGMQTLLGPGEVPPTSKPVDSKPYEGNGHGTNGNGNGTH